jgi:hypothetical protein
LLGVRLCQRKRPVTDRPEQWPHLDDILAAYTPADAAEQQFKVRISALLTLEPRALWRDAFSPGHFTGSALVTSPGRDQVLLMRHKYIGRWMQFGGHADGEADLSKVALREASEESGLPEHKFAVLPSHRRQSREGRAGARAFRHALPSGAR